MENIFEYDGYKPLIHISAFIHPHANIIGNVQIGKNVYIGSGASIRGDIGEIIIEDGCNVQENCIIHMFPGISVVLEKDVHIGHGAIIHGARIGRNVLVGMNSVIMDDSVIGENSIIGAMCLVPAGMKIPPNKVVFGNPAKIIKDVTDEMIEWKNQGTLLYQEIAKISNITLKPCEPLREILADRKIQQKTIETWNKKKEK